MQPPTDSPREAFTDQHIRDLIQNTPGLIVGRGLELLDQDLNVLDDLTGDFRGGSVTRQAYATLHGAAELHISRQLDWGQAIVRPYMTLSDGVTTATFHLGAYYTSVSEHSLEEAPPTFSVQGHDILLALADPVGDVHVVNTGTAYLTAVEDILIARGFTQYVIDPSAADRVLAVARTWPLDANVTWLTVVNDLLAAVGYAGAWSDWHGRIRCEPYQPPRQRASEWDYTVDGLTSMLSRKRALVRDIFGAPNRWTFWRSGDADGPPPVEGDGKYTYINEDLGDTSVAARGGRVISAPPEQLEAVDQTALVAQALARIDADMAIPTQVQVETAPNPLSWHFDRYTLGDPAAGPIAEVQATAWTLPLDGGDMTQIWQVLG